MRSAAKTANYVFHEKFKHIIRFSAVGVANTFIDFLIFTMFHELFRWSYIASQILGYSFGILNSFILNKKWTFNDVNSNKKTLHELIEFVVVNLITLTTTLIVMNLLVKHLSLNVYLSKIIVTMAAQVTNFLAYKLWVFE